MRSETKAKMCDMLELQLYSGFVSGWIGDKHTYIHIFNCIYLSMSVCAHSSCLTDCVQFTQRVRQLKADAAIIQTANLKYSKFI